MMLRWLAVTFLAMLAFVPAASARDLVVGVEAIDYRPVYSYRDGRFQGASAEILDAFAKAKGHRLTYRAFPIKRLLAELIHGGIDLKYPDNANWQAPARQGSSIVYSRPVVAYVDGVVVRADRRMPSLDEVKSLGTVAGFTPFGWLDRIKDGKLELKENPSFEQLLRQVQTGRIDGAYVNVAVALGAADGVLGVPGALVFAQGLPHTADSYRLSSAKSPEIIAEFDEWLAANARLVSQIIARTGAEKGVR